MLLHIVDQDCVGFMSPQNSFVITYLHEDEQELSLGVLIRCKRIYHVWCSMLVFYPMSHVFYAFTFVSRLISYTNILTRCPRPVVVFCCFLYFIKALKEIFSERAENPRRSFFTRNKDQHRRRPEGGHQARATLGRAWGPPGSPGHRLSSLLRL